jgi:GT2 family glycosyltransferase
VPTPSGAQRVRAEAATVPELSGDTGPLALTGGVLASEIPSAGRVVAPPVLVSAVVVVRDGSTWLAECLDSIAAQTVRPARLVIVDVGSTDTSLAIATAHRPVRQTVGDVTVLEAAKGLSLGAAVEFGVAALPRVCDPAQEWIWVVHDGAAARTSTLEQLLGAVRRSPSVGVAGPKIVGWDEPRRLVELGIQITHSGRPIASPARGEADQGQHDGRTDVLAVSTSGMLVRRDVFDELGGFDPAFETYGAGLDFGWRAQLAGHRVIVVPSATYRDASLVDLAQPGRPRLGEVDRRNRRAARQAALARSSPLAAPFLALWMALSALVSSVTLLVAKRPRQAWRELGDLSALFHPVATTRARWRGRSTKRLSRSALATLFVSPDAAARITLDHIQDAISPERVRRREAALTTETGPVGDTAESLDALPASLPRRIATHPGFLAVVATVAATVLAWRDAIAAGALSASSTGLAGAELRPVTTDAAGLWHAFRDAWHGAGLGTGTDSSPYLAVLAGMTWVVERLPGTDASRSPAGLTIAALLFAAPALSTWAAYLASRVVTPARIPRAVVALAWGTSATLTSALAEGRVTAALAHLLLPFVLAGFVLAGRRDGTYTAAFATALAAAVVGAFVPVLLALAALAALLLLILGRGGRRWRGVVLLIVPAALLGPWAAHFAEDWRALLSGPGLIATGPAPAPWMSALGLADPMTGPWAWLAAPVLLLGVAGYAVRTHTRSESVGLAAGALVAILGLTGALAATRVVLGSAETSIGVSEAARLWSGPLVDLWIAGLLAGVLWGGGAVLERLGRPFRRWSFVAAAAIVALVVVPVFAGAVRWAAEGGGGALTVGQASLPAVAVEQSGPPTSNRLLLLQPSGGVVDFRLAGEEPGELLRDLDRAADVDGSALVAAVAAVVGGDAALDSSELARLAVGFVQVEASPDSDLARRLDASEGLSRLGTSAQGILWRVRPLPAAPRATGVTVPSRVRLVDASDRVLAIAPTSGPHAAVSHQLGPAAGDRRVVVAEPREWAAHAVVSLDGRVLTAVPGAAQPTYAVPRQGGHLTIDLAAAQPWWRLGQALLLAFVVFMALPFGNRRSRRRP